MSALCLDDPRHVFLLGYLSAQGQSASASALDRTYVSQLLEVTGISREAHYQVDWPSEPSSILQVRAPAEPPVPIEERALCAFVRGAFSAVAVADADERGEPRIVLKDRNAPFQSYIRSVLGLPEPEEGSWRGLAALDALGRVLKDAPLALPSFAQTFEQWCVQIAYLTSLAPRDQKMLVRLVHPQARIPQKEHVSDSGYDLTLLYEKQRFGRTILYGTGVIVEPPFGWYFDVVPRSSIIKRGYILANSVGVIDRSYRGEIFVPLIKVDEAASELELPARVAQLIPRPIVHFHVEAKRALSDTRRGAGGFGSTGE